MTQKRKQLDYLKHSLQSVRSLSASQEDCIRRSLPTLRISETITGKQQLQALEDQEDSLQQRVERAEASLARHKEEFPLKKRKSECEKLEKENEAMDALLLEDRKAIKQLRIKCIKLGKEKEKLKLAIQEEQSKSQQRKRELQSFPLADSSLSEELTAELASIPKGREQSLWSEAFHSLSVHREKTLSASHLLQALRAKQNPAVLEQLSVLASEQSEMRHALDVIVSDLAHCEVAFDGAFEADRSEGARRAALLSAARRDLVDQPNAQRAVPRDHSLHIHWNRAKPFT